MKANVECFLDIEVEVLKSIKEFKNKPSLKNCFLHKEIPNKDELPNGRWE